MGATFDLQSAQSAKERMDELEKFILFWLGPRRPEYGEPDSALEQVSLPYPLQRLYAFAGNWPPLRGYYANQPNVFCNQDYLIPLSKLKQLEDGKLKFLVENQSCWICATLPYGDDPPVWVEGDFLPSSGWHLVTESLSRFVVSFCLQELLFGSMPWDGRDPEHPIADRLGSAVPLWTNGPFVHFPTEHSFYLLGENILIGPWGLDSPSYGEGGPWFAIRPTIM